MRFYLLIFVFVFQSVAYGHDLRPFNLNQLGVRNQGFSVQASEHALEQFRQNPQRCQKLMDYVQDPMNTFGVVVRKNGETIFKLRRRESGSQELFKMFSTSKMVSALMLGAFLYRHPQWNLNTKASHLMDLGENGEDRNGARDDITLYHLISQGSGLSWCEYAKCLGIHSLRVNFGKRSTDALDFVLSQPVSRRPGTRYNYSSGNYLVLHGILREHLGERFYRQVYQRYLFSPLGINKSAVETDDTGLMHGGSGVWITNEAMAKLGQLVVNKGLWRGKRIISESFINTMLTVPEGIKRSGRKIRQWEGAAGASLWTNLNVEDLQQAIPGVTESMVYSSGFYGQFLLMYPEHNLVVARVGGDVNHGDRWFKFTRDASGCFGGSDVLSPDGAIENDRGDGPGNFLWTLDGITKALPERLPMNAYAQEMCSCLFTGGAIRHGVKGGVQYCDKLRPLPDQIASRQSFAVEVDVAKKRVKAVMSSKPKLDTYSLAEHIPGQACRLIKRARPSLAPNDGSWEAKNDPPNL